MINCSSHKYTAMSKFEVLMWALSTSSFWTYVIYDEGQVWWCHHSVGLSVGVSVNDGGLPGLEQSPQQGRQRNETKMAVWNGKSCSRKLSTVPMKYPDGGIPMKA